MQPGATAVIGGVAAPAWPERVGVLGVGSRGAPGLRSSSEDEASSSDEASSRSSPALTEASETPAVTGGASAAWAAGLPASAAMAMPTKARTSSGSTSTAVPSDDVLSSVGAGGDRAERDRTGGEALHLAGEAEHVPPGVERDRARDRLGDPREREGVGEGVGREQRLGGAREEHLLARDAVEVAVRQAVALADERERLRAADLLRAGRQRQAGVRVPGRRAQAHRDAADRGADVGEAREVDRGEVRDRQPGQLLDGPDRGARAGGGRGAHHRGVVRRERRGGLGGEEARAAGRPRSGHGVGRLRRGARPGRIDLVSAEALPQVDVGVARHRDRGGATAAGGHVHDGQRVGRPAAGIARAGVERGQDVAGQLVALRVGAGVETDEQDVLLARRRGLGRVDDGRGRRGSIQSAQLCPPEGGSDEDGHRQDAHGETREESHAPRAQEGADHKNSVPPSRPGVTSQCRASQ